MYSILTKSVDLQIFVFFFFCQFISICFFLAKTVQLTMNKWLITVLVCTIILVLVRESRAGALGSGGEVKPGHTDVGPKTEKPTVPVTKDVKEDIDGKRKKTKKSKKDSSKSKKVSNKKDKKTSKKSSKKSKKSDRNDKKDGKRTKSVKQVNKSGPKKS